MKKNKRIAGKADFVLWAIWIFALTHGLNSGWITSEDLPTRFILLYVPLIFIMRLGPRIQFMLASLFMVLLAITRVILPTAPEPYNFSILVYYFLLIGIIQGFISLFTPFMQYEKNN